VTRRLIVLVAVAAALGRPIAAQAVSVPDTTARDTLGAHTVEIAADSLRTSLRPPDGPVDTGFLEVPGAEADTSAWRFEAGMSSDFTNEQFYEDAFVDTIALGRRLVSTPETRAAGVVSAAWAGTRGARASRYDVRTEATLGDKIRRGSVNGAWRSPIGPDWRLYAAPRGEYRRDRTFDRDLEEWRGAVALRLRRDVPGVPVPELGLDADFLRTRGEGADFLPDRDGARASVGLGSGAWTTSDWRVGYAIGARAFPDSTERDHFEHGLETRWRRDLGTVTVALDGAALRRVTMRSVTTSRDNFWDGLATADLDLRSGLWWTWRLKLSAEAMRYDVEDSTLYFDYQILRARAGPRRDAGGWGVSAGPRAELLRSPTNPVEAYVEFGGFVDVEYIGPGFWTFSPSIGRRAYRETTSGDAFSATAVHSPYTFFEVSLVGDQPLGGGVRLRALGAGRLERHGDSADDARSLYFSLDVRRLF
jgi:hypothetical protein